MVQKQGFNPYDPVEKKTGMDIMLGKKIVLGESGNYDIWPQICLMTKNITLDEYEECVKLSPSQVSDSTQSFLQ